MKKKSIIARGPWLTHSGYGVHGRQIAKWLIQREDLDVKFIVTRWGITPWIVDIGEKNSLIEQILTRIIDPKSSLESDVSIQLQLPNEWDPKLSKNGINIGITALSEADKCPPSWVSNCNSMNSVIVPSQH